MNIRARIAHQTEGRVRLQLPGHRGDKQLFERLSQQFADTGRVHKMRANPVTGSVVLEFSGALNELLAAGASADGAIRIELDLPPGAAGAAEDLPVREAAQFFRLVGGRSINPMMVAGTVFGAVALLQTLRGEIMVPALSAFWYATRAFRLARTSPPAPRAGPDGAVT